VLGISPGGLSGWDDPIVIGVGAFWGWRVLHELSDPDSVRALDVLGTASTALGALAASALVGAGVSMLRPAGRPTPLRVERDEGVVGGAHVGGAAERPFQAPYRPHRWTFTCAAGSGPVCVSSHNARGEPGTHPH
jgi:hypothetical protein